MMLRADAGSVAKDFIGAPVLEEDSTRCELTRWCRRNPAQGLSCKLMQYAGMARQERVQHLICLTTVVLCLLVRSNSTTVGQLAAYYRLPCLRCSACT